MSESELRQMIFLISLTQKLLVSRIMGRWNSMELSYSEGRGTQIPNSLEKIRRARIRIDPQLDFKQGP